MDSVPPAVLQPASDVLTRDDVAGLLRCSTRHLDNLMGRGLIPHIRLGRSVRFRRTSVLAALAALERGGVS